MQIDDFKEYISKKIEERTGNFYGLITDVPRHDRESVLLCVTAYDMKTANLVSYLFELKSSPFGNVVPGDTDESRYLLSKEIVDKYAPVLNMLSIYLYNAVFDHNINELEKSVEVLNLSKEDRDALYSLNISPILRSPACQTGEVSNLSSEDQLFLWMYQNLGSVLSVLTHDDTWLLGQMDKNYRFRRDVPLDEVSEYGTETGGDLTMNSIN